ncbi:glycosyltransferase family 2 protein [Nostoc punctiforme]|uniref:Glycosyl transferase, family 2 n=1 Tax=Nostoc punctiforme (strain ATCC 29133 / PCC 73102) TaxID=63737 RepID=B2IVT5_NOSP7|nr:glycosyltransferase family 2 protein [Nostoc punctiforme]ACC82898.1 glycosyl transferase, family 2 [Nostoc punctiforme PCC 73102]
MKSQYKIAAYITAYEDPKAVMDCLNAIACQSSFAIDKLLILDNSTKKPLLHLTNKENILIKFHPENIGIAAGLTWAIKWAIEQEYDFLWSFDQDSVPAANCLEILLKTYYQLSQQDNYKIGIIAPTPSDPRTSKVIEGAVFFNDHFLALKHNSSVDFYECDSPITSGSLISLAAAKTISPPCVDLFIDGIDLDYGLRLRQKGFHNLIATKAIMHHNFGSPIQVKFMNKYRYIQQYSALRYYYICRNHSYLETRFSQGYYHFTSLMRRIKYMLLQILFIMLYDLEDKQLKIWACLLGTYRGLIGNISKTW